MDEPKLKSIDIKIQSAARRAEQERNAGPKVLNPERFERDDHLPDGTVNVTPTHKVLTTLDGQIVHFTA